MHSDDPRLAGVLIPAFSARRCNDLGIGDTRALCQWVDWAARYGVGFIQLLPINENGNEESPYSAISSIALDPIYLSLDHEDIPWLETKVITNAQSKAASLRQLPHVDYPRVREIKRNLLELAWAHFEDASPDLHDDLADFRKSEADWLQDYCRFRFLMEQHGESLTWDEWPESCQSPEQAHFFINQLRKQDPASVDYRLSFFAFVQWLCFRQWRDLRRHADESGVKLMGDVPIGIARHSCDVFFNRDDFHLEWCGGSPAEGNNPDNPFFSQWGQNWGIPLYRWDQMEANGFRWWHQRINRLTEIFSMFRLDHILGFYRIYAFPWQPRDNHRFINLNHDQAKQLTGDRLPHWRERADDSAENREANRIDGDRRLKAILDGVDRENVVAEDLGWVPDYVRPHLADLGIAGFKVPHWDCAPGQPPTAPTHFPQNAFATYSTHDHEPINTIWKNCVKTIEGHRHHPSEASRWQAEGADHALRTLCRFAGIEISENRFPPPYSESIRLRLLHALLSTRSRLASFMVTELFDVDARINEPGSHSNRNWIFRVPWTIAEIESSPDLLEICRKVSIAISLSHRNPDHQKNA